VHIEIIPTDYSNAIELATAVEGIIKQHPLISSDDMRNKLSRMLISVRLGEDIHPFDIKCDAEKNIINLKFGRWHLNHRQEWAKAIYHEFTHCIDRLNPDFGITEQKEQAADTLQPAEIPCTQLQLWEHIWNCYIDGRLECHKLNPTTLECRKEELHSVNCKSKGFDPRVDLVLNRAWNGTNLTFDDLLLLTQECQNCWGLKGASPLSLNFFPSPID
jgi:hypothetical protein